MKLKLKKLATMLRIATIIVSLAVVLLVGAGNLWAGAGNLWAGGGNQWPAFQPAPTPGTDFRGPGGYLSWVKIIAC